MRIGCWRNWLLRDGGDGEKVSGAFVGLALETDQGAQKVHGREMA